MKKLFIYALILALYSFVFSQNMYRNTGESTAADVSDLQDTVAVHLDTLQAHNDRINSKVDSSDINTETKLEAYLYGTPNVFTSNDGALNDDDVSLTDVQSATTNDFHNIGGTDDITTVTGDDANTTTSDITLAGAGISVTSVSGNTVTITSTEVDGSTTNEINTITGDDLNATSALGITIAGGGINATTVAGNTVTVTGTEVDGSTTNEINTFTGDDLNATSGLGVTIAGGGINATTVAGNTVTITGTEVDGSVTNEIEVVDESYTSGNFDGGTASAVSQDDFYDYNHIADTDDDGKIEIVDLGSAGLVVTDASGNLSVDGSTAADVSDLQDTVAVHLDTLQAMRTDVNNKQQSDAELDGLSALSGTGLVTQTAAGAFTNRTVAGTTAEIEIANGDGVSGNINIGLPDSVAISEISINNAVCTAYSSSGANVSFWLARNAHKYDGKYYRFLDDNDAPMIGLGSGGDLSFYTPTDAGNTAGSEISFQRRFDIDKNGNVQIGVDIPTSKLGISGIGTSPIIKLHTDNNPSSSRNYIEFDKYGYTTKGSVGALGNFEMNMSYNMDYADGVHRYYNSSNNAYWIALNSTGLHLQYSPSGYGGGDDIWTNQGSHKLQIQMDAYNNPTITNTTDTLSFKGTSPSLRIHDDKTGTWNNGDALGSLDFYSNDNIGVGNAGVAASIKAAHLRGGTGHTWSDAGIDFYTTYSGDELSRKMVLSNIGYLGIGLFNPQAPIHILNTNTPQVVITHTDKVDSLSIAVDGDGNADFTPSGGTFNVVGALTEGDNDVYNSSETPGGELGGTWASPTVDSGIHDDEYVQLEDSTGHAANSYFSRAAGVDTASNIRDDYILGDGTAGRKFRQFCININPGTTPNTNIDVQNQNDASYQLNEPTFTNATDLAKSGTSGSFSLSADGTTIEFNASNVLRILDWNVLFQDLNSSSTTYYNPKVCMSGGEIWITVTTLGNASDIDWTTIVDAGDQIAIEIFYLASN